MFQSDAFTGQFETASSPEERAVAAAELHELFESLSPVEKAVFLDGHGYDAPDRSLMHTVMDGLVRTALLDVVPTEFRGGPLSPMEEAVMDLGAEAFALGVSGHLEAEGIQDFFEVQERSVEIACGEL